ncbi:hypothetical protein BN873_980057 [Candidatus Competibacter denitrificans Run_A_D11]|uniref:Uncharacterized protein n=1 Tax=Candidatus Competibacter denitrificans Run_A_D11 TaxID=1400863 RepID=W6M8Y2_9GAMM|nr:hypothetical protein BN873_980057 [Candidatus Competibacter denitrificans Run_A_D11]
MSSGEIKINRPFPYSIRMRSSDSAGFENTVDVSVISRMLAIGIFHRNGPLVISSLSASTTYFVPSRSQTGNIIPISSKHTVASKNTVANGVSLKVSSVTNPSMLVATARIITTKSQVSILDLYVVAMMLSYALTFELSCPLGGWLERVVRPQCSSRPQ